MIKHRVTIYNKEDMSEVVSQQFDERKQAQVFEGGVWFGLRIGKVADNFRVVIKEVETEKEATNEPTRKSSPEFVAYFKSQMNEQE